MLQPPCTPWRVHPRSSGHRLAWRFLLAALATVALLLAGRPARTSAQFAGGLNATLTVSPSSAAAGQVVTFSYSVAPPAVAPPFPSITSVQMSYGDGQADIGNTGGSGQTVTGVVTHVYSSPGTYTATLTATASNGSSGTAVAIVSVSGGGGGTVSVSVNASPGVANVGQPVVFTYSATPSFGIGFPQIRSMLINYGDGAPLPLTPPSGTVSHTYAASGTYTVVVTATDSSGGSGQASTLVQVAQRPTPPLVISAGASMTGTAGTPLTFGATVSGAVSPTVTWSFGDGTTGSGLFTTHAYAAPGAYTARATVVDSSTGRQASDSIIVTIGSALSVDANGPYRGITGQPITLNATVTGATRPQYQWSFGNGRTSAAANPSVTYSSAGTYTITLTVTDTATGRTASDTATAVVEASGPVVTYTQGWNLVAGPTGTQFEQAGGPLYTFQAGDTAYQVIDPASGVTSGLGYWAYFSALTTVTMAGNGSTSATINVPAGQYVMVGNPSATTTVTIKGADVAQSWDPQTNAWKNVSTLAPGAGAWVYIAAGGAVILSP